MNLFSKSTGNIRISQYSGNIRLRRATAHAVVRRWLTSGEVERPTCEPRPGIVQDKLGHTLR